MNQLHKKGFTLIELLVVISIIGLLASIVLAALSASKLKAQDARVMSEMVSLRTAAEMYRSAHSDTYSDHSFYDDYFGRRNLSLHELNGFLNDSTSGGLQILTDIAVLNGADTTSAGGGMGYLHYGISPTSYKIYAKVPSSLSYICLDSSGVITVNSSQRWGRGTPPDFGPLQGDTIPYACP